MVAGDDQVADLAGAAKREMGGDAWVAVEVLTERSERASGPARIQCRSR